MGMKFENCEVGFGKNMSWEMGLEPVSIWRRPDVLPHMETCPAVSSPMSGRPPSGKSARVQIFQQSSTIRRPVAVILGMPGNAVWYCRQLIFPKFIGAACNFSKRVSGSGNFMLLDKQKVSDFSGEYSRPEFWVESCRWTFTNLNLF